MKRREKNITHIYSRLSFEESAEPPNTSDTKSDDRFWYVALVATAAHLGNLVGMLVIYWGGFDGQKKRDSCFQTSVGYLKWYNVTNAPTYNCSSGRSVFLNTSDGEYMIREETHLDVQLSLHWLIAAFHLLSFVFQGAALLPFYKYTKKVEQGKNPLRFLEYSISASIMLICLGLLNGIVDGNELAMIAILCAVTQLCGLASEVLMSDAMTLAKSEDAVVKSIRLVATLMHLTGWVALMTAYGVIWRYFILSATGSDEARPPEFVYVIVVMLFLLFNSFGIVQVVQISRYGYSKKCRVCCRRGVCCDALCRDQMEVYDDEEEFLKEANRKRADKQFNHIIELAYTSLSLGAKTVLGWMLYFNVLRMARECV